MGGNWELFTCISILTVAGFLILFTLTNFSPPDAFADSVIHVGFGSNTFPWTCPPRVGLGQIDTTAPPKNKAGDRLYLHVTDAKGNNFQVWCESHFGILGNSYNFNYKISKGGKTIDIDTCELVGGKNKLSLKINGTAGPKKAVGGGTITIKINGDIKSYSHHNYNNAEDFHSLYDLATGKFIRINTEKKTDSNGKTYTKVSKPKTSIISLVNPPLDIDPNKPDYASLDPDEFGTETFCQLGDPDESNILTSEIITLDQKGQAGIEYNIIHTEILKLENVNFDFEKILLEFDRPVQDFLGPIDIIIPRYLMDHGEEGFTILVNDENVEFEEQTTDTHRVITFETENIPNHIEIIGTIGQNPDFEFEVIEDQTEEDTPEEIADFTYFYYLNLLENRVEKYGDEYMLPPNFQGVLLENPEDIICNEGLERMTKSSNGATICVKPSTAEKMITRGLAEPF